jgi:hypothetical protein
MAVDRNAVAWVNLRDMTVNTKTRILFKVDTKTAKCTPNDIPGSKGGMGFSTEGTSTEETLFTTTSVDGQLQFARVDFEGNRFVPISPWNDGLDREYTGTGDGRLYGMLIGSSISLTEIDKKTGALSNSVALPQVPLPYGVLYAFSFWGGDFYFYTATGSDDAAGKVDYVHAKNSVVTRYRPSDGSIEPNYMTDIGFKITGAGVSTCAPVSAPR